MSSLGSRHQSESEILLAPPPDDWAHNFVSFFVCQPASRIKLLSLSGPTQSAGNKHAPRGKAKLKLIKSNFDLTASLRHNLFVLFSLARSFSRVPTWSSSLLGHLMTSRESRIDTYQLSANCITANAIISHSFLARNRFFVADCQCDNGIVSLRGMRRNRKVSFLLRNC